MQGCDFRIHVYGVGLREKGVTWRFMGSYKWDYK